MTWLESITLNSLPGQWVTTPVIEGDFIKISHQTSGLNNSFFTGTIAQAEIDDNEQLNLYDFRQIKATDDVTVLHFPKPNCFQNRRLAFKADPYALLAAGQVWDWSLNIKISLTSNTNITEQFAITSNPLIEYRFDEGFGQQLTNYSRDFLHGTLGNSSVVDSQDPDWNPLYGALNFSNNKYVSLPTRNWLPASFYIESVIYLRSYSNWSRLFDFANSPNSTNNNIFLSVSRNNTGIPEFTIANNTNRTSIASTSPIPLNKWIHLSCDYNNSTGNIYLNLVPIASQAMVAPQDASKSLNYIGRSSYSSDSYLDGYIAAFNIYEKKLTPKERLNNFKYLKNRLENNLIMLNF